MLRIAEGIRDGSLEGSRDGGTRDAVWRVVVAVWRGRTGVKYDGRLCWDNCSPGEGRGAVSTVGVLDSGAPFVVFSSHRGSSLAVADDGVERDDDDECRADGTWASPSCRPFALFEDEPSAMLNLLLLLLLLCEHGQGHQLCLPRGAAYYTAHFKKHIGRKDI